MFTFLHACRDLRLAAVETVYGSPTKKADDPDASSEVSDETAFLDVASSLSSNAAASGNEADAMEVPSTLGSNEQVLRTPFLAV